MRPIHLYSLVVLIPSQNSEIQNLAPVSMCQWFSHTNHQCFCSIEWQSFATTSNYSCISFKLMCFAKDRRFRIIRITGDEKCTCSKCLIYSNRAVNHSNRAVIYLHWFTNLSNLNTLGGLDLRGPLCTQNALIQQLFPILDNWGIVDKWGSYCNQLEWVKNF